MKFWATLCCRVVAAPVIFFFFPCDFRRRKFHEMSQLFFERILFTFRAILIWLFSQEFYLLKERIKNTIIWRRKRVKTHTCAKHKFVMNIRLFLINFCRKFALWKMYKLFIVGKKKKMPFFSLSIIFKVEHQSLFAQKREKVCFWCLEFWANNAHNY